MGMAIDFMADPRIAQAAVSSISLNASLAALQPAPKRNPVLRFADLFIDGCDVRLFQGIDCHTEAALPDGTLVDLGGIYRGRSRLAEFGFDDAV